MTKNLIQNWKNFPIINNNKINKEHTAQRTLRKKQQEYYTEITKKLHFFKKSIALIIYYDIIIA